MSKNAIDFKPEIYKLGSVVLVKSSEQPKGEYGHIAGFSLSPTEELLICVKLPIRRFEGTWNPLNYFETIVHPSRVTVL